MIIAILQAIRANAQATVEMVDGMLATLKQLEQEEQAAEAAHVEYSAATCTHPQNARRPIPRMGAPTAYVCGLCGQAGGTEEAQARVAAPNEEG